MPGSTYSTNLKVELMATGENSGTWGDITNTNLGTALEQAIVGYGNPDYASDANLTISITNSNAAQAARALVLNVTSSVSLTATRELVVPTIQKQYIVQNNTTGSQSITVKTSAGTGITVPNGRKAHLYVNGTDVIQMFDFVDINGGAIDGTPIGASSASTGAFTTLNASGATTLDGNVTLGNASGDNVTVTGTITSNLLFTDNTYDIGASGATRPRNLFLAGAATIGGNLSVGGTLTLTGGLILNGNVTVGDSSADTLTVNATITSNLLFTDNTYDIGASGATRPRNLFLAGNATIGGNQTLTGSLTVDSTTDSSSTTTGSIQTDGGVGMAKALYVGTTATIAGTTDSSSSTTGALTTSGGLGVAKSAYFGGPILRVNNAAPFLTVNNSSGGSAILELVSQGNWNWNIRGTATEQSFWRDSVNYWYWNSTSIVSSLNIVPSASSTYNIGSTAGYWNNLYFNYLKPVGGSAYTSTAMIDVYPDTNSLRFFHSGTPSSDLNIGAAGSAAGGGTVAESVAYQATFSNGPGFIFSTQFTAGGKLLSLTSGGVGIGKNSAAYSLDIAPASTSDGLMVRRAGTSATGFFISGDGTVQWGNGTTDYGQLSWNTGYAIVGAKGSLYLNTNTGVSSVNALFLSTTGAATFASNISYPSGSYLASGNFSRLWIPGQVIGSGYGGLYGQALTYLAKYDGGWKSLGGGTGTAITIDEGCFQLSKSNGVGAADVALTWSPVIGTSGQQVGIGRYTPSSFTDLSITQNSTYGIGVDNTAGTQNYSWRIDSTNSNAWTFGTRTTSVDLYYVLPGGNAVYTQTGALRVHNGTTAQRSTSSAGAIRWNTSYPRLEVADGTNYQAIVTEPVVTATGGTITTDGDYKIHTFTTSGTFTISAISGAARALVEILVVGGGGGGGFYLGGGGGAGAFLQDFFYMTATSYTVTVGAGGNSVNSGFSYSSNGGASSVTGGILGSLVTAYGGGAGGNGAANDAWGANGSASRVVGSGGGGGSPYGFATGTGQMSAFYGGSAGKGGSGGGYGTLYSGTTFNGGGGGGGAQGPGVAPNIGNGPVGAGGYGGNGINSYITGTGVDYAGGGGGGYGTYLANLTIGGGSGGGGSGVGTASSGANLQATAGGTNTGGGGGGGQQSSGYQQGGNGGSGIVIIRYKYQ